ncbi:hypothetical protein [Ponticaulis profundi]|uniref:Uncharacterized protein n=1 Tax=Ponticaulis profundi TaxID=2665222 RepID=A0ABW1S4K8_9PROT
MFSLPVAVNLAAIGAMGRILREALMGRVEHDLAAAPASQIAEKDSLFTDRACEDLHIRVLSVSGMN